MEIKERDPISQREERIRKIIKVVIDNNNKPYRFIVSKIMREVGISERLAKENVKMLLLNRELKIDSDSNLRVKEGG